MSSSRPATTVLSIPAMFLPKSIFALIPTVAATILSSPLKASTVSSPIKDAATVHLRSNVQFFNRFYWSGDSISYNIEDQECRNLDQAVRNQVLSAHIDDRTIRGCMFFDAEDCIRQNPVFLPALSYSRVPEEASYAVSFRCYPTDEDSSSRLAISQSHDASYPALKTSAFQTSTRPNGQPNGTVTLFTYPHFKGQYKKFRVFSNHCYLPPRKLRNAVKSLIISDTIDSCTFWSEPGCKGEPYWLPAGKIENLKGEGNGFVSVQCLLVGEGDGDGNDEAEAEAEGEEWRKREGSTHY